MGYLLRQGSDDASRPVDRRNVRCEGRNEARNGPESLLKDMQLSTRNGSAHGGSFASGPADGSVEEANRAPCVSNFYYSRKAFTYERSTEYGGFLGKFYNSISLGPRPFIDLRVCMRSDPQPIA